MSDLVQLKVESHALIEAPVFESHQRGRNWLARISVDPSSPGGMGREFLPRARGDFLYTVEALELYDAVEFGADYYSQSNNVTRKRWHGVVMGISEGMITLEKCATGAKAIRRAREAKENISDQRRTLEILKAELLARVAKINEQLATLDAEEKAKKPAPAPVLTTHTHSAAETVQ